MGYSEQFAYTVDGQSKVTQTDVTDPKGNVRRVTFNTNGYALTDTRVYGTAVAQTTTHTRDATSNLVTSMTDALGRQTAYTYDTPGNVLTITRLAGTGNAVTTTFSYEPTFNQVASIPDEGTVFLTRTGRRFHPNHLSRLARDYIVAAGVAKRGRVTCCVIRWRRRYWSTAPTSA